MHQVYSRRDEIGHPGPPIRCFDPSGQGMGAVQNRTCGWQAGMPRVSGGTSSPQADGPPVENMYDSFPPDFASGELAEITTETQRSIRGSLTGFSPADILAIGLGDGGRSVAPTPVGSFRKLELPAGTRRKTSKGQATSEEESRFPRFFDTLEYREGNPERGFFLKCLRGGQTSCGVPKPG